ncbi:CPBP family intramembrane metalloprotease [Pseudoxanthomonas broegbernensis]|uniref:CPBP family intramembrane metalloprotease n=1 Tax=Pseudoxanthomonas broegbernensis TaxID=83619 RepID=A0A7V8GN04_9GAMM|nr:CPBP family intramembrane glutamic endopeptidase [Pseudoxanthomonas broegbernensis]KAF1686831.1 CPBP family intramembrane metalloprotease [Pseudoxanthomonas broegbernensis]MBB6065584.1 hypothetical protein [Pseudoxanthomonas broegbernensis]
MSEPADGANPGAVPPSLPPERTGALVGRFLVDAAVAFVVLSAVGMVAGMAWAAWRAFQVVGQGPGPAPDAQAIAQALGQPGVLAQILMAVLGMSSAALLLYFWRRRADAGERARSRAAARRPSTWAWSLSIGLAVFAGSTLIGWLMRQAGVEPVPSNLPMVEEASQRWPLFLFVFAVVLAPAYEELLFRRVLFGRFLAAGRPWLGLVLSSLAFALVHEVPGLSGNPPLAVLQLWLVYAGMGAAFAWVYRRTGTLWSPIAAHALNNAVALYVHGLV